MCGSNNGRNVSDMEGICSLQDPQAHVQRFIYQIQPDKCATSGNTLLIKLHIRHSASWWLHNCFWFHTDPAEKLFFLYWYRSLSSRPNCFFLLDLSVHDERRCRWCCSSQLCAQRSDISLMSRECWETLHLWNNHNSFFHTTFPAPHPPCIVFLTT